MGGVPTRDFFRPNFFPIFQQNFFSKTYHRRPLSYKNKKWSTRRVDHFLFLYIPRKYAISPLLFFSLRRKPDEQLPQAQNGSLNDRENPIEQRTEAQYRGLYFWALINKTEEREVNWTFIDFYRTFPCVWVDENLVREQQKFLTDISPLLSRLFLATQHLTQIFIFCRNLKKGR